MNFLPISINIENKPILVVGGGKVATRKVQTLLDFNCKITVLAPEVSNEIMRAQTVEVLETEYQKSHLSGRFMVFACTDQEGVNAQILKDAEDLGVLCNRTDSAEASHFHSSAMVESHEFMIGINSKEKAPARLKEYRNELAAFIREREHWWQQKTSLKGQVFLVGFGPGNPDFMTKRAEQLLSIADVIFYDDLLDPDALDQYTGEKVYVGKRRGNHSKEQHEINEVLYQAALQNKVVVRLKGGDPLIFGRGSEEAFYLKQRGVEVTIVPGISSAIAAASCANIPLTHRGISSTLAFGTAHGKQSFKILEADTSVYYMGAKNIRAIAAKYVEAGYPYDYPVGLVMRASLPTQKVLKTTLKALLEEDLEIESPLISIFGKTVNYEEILKQECYKVKESILMQER